DLRELLQERTEPQLTEVEMPVVADQRLQLRLERRRIELRARALTREREHDVGEEGRVLLPEGEQQEQERLAQGTVDLAGHAEIEQVDRAVPPQEVPGMRVGVEEAVGEDLLVVGLEELASGLPAFVPLG